MVPVVSCADAAIAAAATSKTASASLRMLVLPAGEVTTRLRGRARSAGLLRDRQPVIFPTVILLDGARNGDRVSRNRFRRRVMHRPEVSEIDDDRVAILFGLVRE